MSEEDLIKASKKNKREAQSELYVLYKRIWFSICLRYQNERADAEDSLQNALIKIYSNLNQFDSAKGKFKSWSSRIVVNENLMLLRKKVKSFELVHLEIEPQVSDNSETPLERLSAKELTEVIAELPAGYRTVFNLYVLDGYGHKEIAEELGITEGTSKSQLFKARKMLKEQLEVLI